MSYYTVEEIEVAINKAKAIINSRTKEVDEYTRGYNDCFSLLVEYDKSLRGENSYFYDFKFKDYTTIKGFFKALKNSGFDSLKDMAEKSNYEIIKTKRPIFGDIAFQARSEDSQLGGAMLAGDGWWITTSELNEGINETRPLFFLETKLLLLARPLRS